LPESEAQDGNGLAARQPNVGIGDETPGRGSNAEGSEVCAVNEDGLRHRSLIAASGRERPRTCLYGDRRVGGKVVAEIDERRERYLIARERMDRVDVLRSRDLRWRAEQQPIDDVEHRRVCTDAEGERGDRSECEGRCAQKLSRRDLEISMDCVEAFEDIEATLAMTCRGEERAALGGGITKPAPGLGFGVANGPSAIDEGVDSFLEMKGDFVFDLAGHQIGPPQREAK
jgi:hypothetical protein